MFSSTEAVDPALLEGGGKVEVWRIDGSARTLVPKGDIGKFYSGDCYIVLYTYHLGEKKEYYLCCWIGEDCNEDDPNMAAQLASSISNSCKGRPVQVCINQGKEPPQFVAIFQLIVVLKGGLSSGYKKFVTDNGVNDETYTAECVALIRISETAVRNNTAVQVDAVATSLNSNECFFLQSGSSIFTWHGNQSTHEQQQLAAEVAELLKPGVSVKHFKEGTESSAFWLALGGKQSYISKEVPQVIVRDSTKATVNNPNHLIKGMFYEIDHNLLGDYAVTLQMTKFVRVKGFSVGRVELYYPSLACFKTFAKNIWKLGVPPMYSPLEVEDTVTFLGRRYTRDDLSMAGMKDGLSFFVKEEFLPEIVEFKVDLTPSYIRLPSGDGCVQSGMLNKSFALVSFTRFGGYRLDDPLEDARFSVDMHLTWVDRTIQSIEDNLSKKSYQLQGFDYWAIENIFVKEGQRVLDKLRANPKSILPRILKSLKERRIDLKWAHGASARILLSFEKLDSELEYFADLKMSNAADLEMPLRDQILSLLEEHQYLSLKELIDMTAQPADLIKVILKNCCKCNKAGKNRHKYEISEDYRKSEEYAESKVHRRCFDRDLPELPILPGLARKAKSPNKSRPNPGWGRTTEP